MKRLSLFLVFLFLFPLSIQAGPFGFLGGSKEAKDISVTDEFANSSSTTVQDVLDDLDAAISGGGATTLKDLVAQSPLIGGENDVLVGEDSDVVIGIQDAAADGSTKGAAAFNSTRFSASSGVIDIASVSGITGADEDDVTDDNVESMTTAGDSGTAPVSDGAGNIVMTDIATQSELDAAGGTDDQTGTEVSFADSNDDFTATSVGAAIEELISDNADGPNSADSKVDWTQLANVPAGFADGTDDGGTGGSPGGSDTQLQYNNSGSFGGIGSVIYDNTNLELADDFRLALGTDADWLFGYEEADEDGLVFQTSATSSSNIGYSMFGISVDTGNSGMTSNQKVFQIGKGAQDAGDANYEELLGLDEDGDLTVGNSLTVAGPVNFTGEVISDAEVADDITISASGSVADGAIPSTIARDTELPTVSDVAYDATSWDGNIDAASKNSIRDKIESLAGGHDAVTLATDADAILGLNTQEINLDTQSANTVFAGPSNGADADPTFRALVADDLPSLSASFLSDVSLTTPSDGDLFQYNGTTSEWEPVSTLDNITFGGFTPNEILLSNASGEATSGTDLPSGTTLDGAAIQTGTDDDQPDAADNIAGIAFADINAGDTYTNYGGVDDDTLNELFGAIDSSWPAGTGAPTDAPYITSAADATLSNETVLTDEASLYGLLSDVTDFVQTSELSYYTDSDVDAHLSGGAGIGYSAGTISNTDTGSDAVTSHESTYDHSSYAVLTDEASLYTYLSDVSDFVQPGELDYFTGTDITGSEAAFDGWDKDTSDDFDGAVSSLSGTLSDLETVTGVSFQTGTDDTGTDDQTAAEVTYDNTDSGLSATDVKAAVDEVDGRVDTLESKSVSNTPSDGSFDPVSTIEGTAGEALSFGDVVFSANNSGSHNWYAYEATTATDGHAFARGIVVESGGISSSATGTIMLEGTIQSTGWSMTSNQDEGSQVYASDTAAGGILTTAPADTDDIMQILGFVLEEDIIYFNPDYTTVVVP